MLAKVLSAALPLLSGEARAVLDVLFQTVGDVRLEHRTPDRVYDLGRFATRGSSSGGAAASFETVARELFLVRPEYTVRYGLRTRRAGALGRIPGARELAVNGGFYLLRNTTTT